ncbi:Oidioi.mRNA.OKI2018_I69.PAR.g11923.t1.cds [Oikopleura dioica]|uniref:Oidioi.mRNA.OKI2018_I69.PAR.g11923.t1.cds n=1 Tax=Oikopleura dioica TaxID=34765 RepID=A0ABN7S109_OIKDI|nr:Oidioi.mRNA.OKI2018_I69.PAR.g11923.t1.cds [Oikopleura dioica]
MGSKPSKSVGPLEHFNIAEIQAIEDENESARAKQLLVIRQRNLRHRSIISRRTLGHRKTIRSSIFEDVALEDLCEASGLECDEVEKTGRVKAKCKEETLRRLTTHEATKEVFQNKESFQKFMDSRMGTKEENPAGGGGMLLNPNFRLDITRSNLSFTRSNLSLSYSKSNTEVAEQSHESSEYKRANTINNPLKPWREYEIMPSIRDMTSEHTLDDCSKRRVSKIMEPMKQKPLSEEFYTPNFGRTSIGPMMESGISITRTDTNNKSHSIQRGRSSYIGPAGRKSVLTNHVTGRSSVITDRSRRQSIAIDALKDRRTSKKKRKSTMEPKTIYSLDQDFKSTLYTTISPENRKKVSIACRVNEETLMMAESMTKSKEKKKKICPFF